VVVSFTDRHSPPTVGQIRQLQAQHLAGTQSTVEHQKEDGEIPRRRHAPQQGVDVLTTERPGQSKR